jgi:chemotaxis protein MotB
VSRTISALMAIGVLVMAGCVTSGTHKQTVEDLDQARKASAKAAVDFDRYKKESAARITGLEEEKTRLSSELLAAQASSTKVQQELEKTRSSLDTTLASRKDMEDDVRKIRAETSGMERLNGELRRERGLLQAKADELEKSLNAAKQELADNAKGLADANARLAGLEAEKTRLSGELAKADGGARELAIKLQAEQATVAALQNDKQLLIARTSTVTDELARLQKRMGELETDASRAKDLEQRLSQRDIELGRLTQGGETLTAEKERLAADKERLSAEKERLEKERAAKEAEIARLTKTQEDLTRSLQAQIEKGDIKIKQVRDRLTINMVEKVLFNSGEAQVKPAGLKVLMQVADVLKTVNDKQIRIEGHTDNVPIRGKLKQKFPTNWELSTARATNVVRYFIEQGGVNRESFEAVGYADTRPVADNETDAGRAENRRIEIVLFPKDLSTIVGDIKP